MNQMYLCQTSYLCQTPYNMPYLQYNRSLCIYNPKTSNMFDSIDTNYYILMTYLIGIFTGILISFEYSAKYYEILYKVNKDQDADDSDNDESGDETNDESGDDSDDEDYKEESGDDSGEESNDDSGEESGDDSKNTTKLIHEILVEQVRDTINTLYICTNDWSNFVSEYSICNRVQVLYPNISKNIIREAMNMEPKYTTGSQYNKKGYRYIMSV